MRAVPPESLTESTKLAYFFLVSTSELLSTDQKKLDISHVRYQPTIYIQHEWNGPYITGWDLKIVIHVYILSYEPKMSILKAKHVKRDTYELEICHELQIYIKLYTV